MALKLTNGSFIAKCTDSFLSIYTIFLEVTFRAKSLATAQYELVLINFALAYY